MIINLHHYFGLNINSWPVLSRLRAFNFLFSMLLFIKYSDYNNFILNIANLIFSTFLWWIIYGREFNLEGKNTSILEKGIKFSIILFISSEIFFFFSFFWSYFHFFLSPTIETGLSWPPFNLLIFKCINVPLINTLILIRSGVTVTIRHYFLIKGIKVNRTWYLKLTIILGIFFTTLQAMEYDRSFFSIRDSTFGTSFFVLTGFHGLHVIVGTLYLFLVLMRFLNAVAIKKKCLRFELASWYWHFVDVVWIFLYFFIYYINN